MRAKMGAASRPIVASAAVWTGGTVATAIGVPDGTSGAPGLYFSADTDTGFYRPGANQIGASKSILLPDGASGAPALAFASNADIGLYLSGTAWK